MDREVGFPDLPTETCDGDAAFNRHISGPFAAELCNSLQAHRRLLARQLDEWAEAEQDMIQSAMADCMSTHHVVQRPPTSARRGGAAGWRAEPPRGGEQSEPGSRSLFSQWGGPALVSDGSYVEGAGRGAPAHQHGLDGQHSVASSRTTAFPIPEGPDGEAAGCCDSYDFDDMRSKVAAHQEALRVSSTFRSNSALLRGVTDSCSSSKSWTPSLSQTVSASFEIVFAFAIVCNSFTIGVEVEYVISHRLTTRPLPFVVINHVFTALFIFELLLRMGVERRAFFTSLNRLWNLFDVVVVVCAILEVVFEVLQHTNRYGFGTLRALRFLRMVRLLRVLRIPRVIRYVNALYHLAFSLTCTIKNLFWAFVLLTLILYLFGLIFAQVVFDHVTTQGNPDDGGAMAEFWGSLSTSMFTLFQCVTDGVSWRLAVQPLEKIHWFWVVVFTIFYAFTFFAVLNVVTAAFVQSSLEGAARDINMITMSTRAKEEAHVQVVEKLFNVLDSHKTGFITLDQFNDNIETESVKAYLALLELHTSSAWKLFKLLDVNGDHKVSLDEFLEGSLRLRGHAKSIDLALIQYEQKWMRKKFSLLLSAKGGISKPRDVVVI